MNTRSRTLPTGLLTLLLLGACQDREALLGPAASAMPAPMCMGVAATIYPGNPGGGRIDPNGAGGLDIRGTSGVDVIVGSAGDDVIDSRGQSDFVCAGDGNDVLVGGGGRDRMNGEAGTDRVDYSGSPAAVIIRLRPDVGQAGGFAQGDRLIAIEDVTGSAHDDNIQGDGGVNVITGGDGNDVINGGTGDDVLVGDAGDDRLVGGPGADQLLGGDGADLLDPGADPDVVQGDGGVDVVTYEESPGGVTVALATGGTGADAEGDSYGLVEGAVGSRFGDELIGTSGPNTLSGGPGTDVLRGGAGDDVLEGGQHEDVLHGDDDNAQAGNDILNGNGGEDTLHGYAGTDVLEGGDGDDDVYGGDGDDSLGGGPGANLLDGGNGLDEGHTESCRDTYVSIEELTADTCVPRTATSTITPLAASLPADGSSTTTVTVQAMDSRARPLTVGGATIVLTTSAGTLENGAAVQGTTLTADDNGDGTYTLTFIAPVTTGDATITGTIEGEAITDNAVITLEAGELHHFAVTGTDGNDIATQSAGAAFDILIVAQDENDNVVTGFTGTVDLVSTPAGYSATSGAFTAGQRTQSVTITTGNSYTLTATKTGDTETGTSASFDVTESPGAVANEVGGSSAPGDPYHASFGSDVELGSSGAQNLLTNDTRGFPAATVTTFGAAQCNDGAGSLQSATNLITDGTAGSAMSLTGVGGCAGGSLLVNADGSVDFTPPSGYTGPFRFQYRIGNAGGTDDAQVTLAVGVRPAATADTYSGGTLIGNLTLDTNTGTAFSVSGNDAGDARVLSIVSETAGDVVLNSNGTFTFVPDPAASGSGGFTYRVTNGFGSVETTLGLTLSSARVWFVDRSVTNGNGVQATPFRDLTDFAAVNDGTAGRPGDNDIIFVRENASAYTGGITLRTGQQLIGQDASASLPSITGITLATHQALPAMSTSAPAATISSSSGNALTLGSGNTLRGFTLATSGGTALLGSSFGTLTLGEDVTFGVTAGTPLDLTTGTVNGTIASIGTGAAISLVSVAGTLAINGGTLSNSSGTALTLNGGNGTFSYAGSISSSGTGRPVSITGRTGGTATLSGSITSTGLGILVQNNSSGSPAITFSGTTKSLSTGANPAVTLSTNSTASISFTNGGLALTSTSGAGFAASGGGTVAVAGTNNTISSTTGNALDLNGVAGGGLTFRSISANGAANGIALNSVTGTGLTVTGDGVNAGSGGTIQSTTGAAVSLVTAPSTSLSHMTVSGATGILGSAFNTLTVGAQVTVTSSGGPALSLTSGTVSGTFANVTGSSSSSNGVTLAGVTGTWGVTAGTVTGSASGAALALSGSGGSGTLSWGGSFSQANAQPLVSVSSHSAGTLNLTGTLTASGASTGLQFAGATGTYNVNPGAASNITGTGGGIAITSSSSGTFSFNSNVSVSHSSGSATGFNVNGSTAAVTYNGGITKSGTATGNLVDVTNHGTGTITFQNGTISSAGFGDGILLNNADGPVNFTGTTTLSGTARVRIQGGSAGAIAFNSGATITNPSGNPGLHIVNGGSPTSVTYAGTISSNAAHRPIHIEGSSSGTIGVSGAVTVTNGGMGVLVQNNTGGTFDFSSGTFSLATAANTALTLSTNSGATLNITGGNLAISTTSGSGILGSGGGTITITGANNTVATTASGTAGVSLNTVTIGGNGVTLKSLNSTGGGTNGLLLASTGAGSFTVTGDGASDTGNTTRGRTTAKLGGGSVNTTSGGTISGKSGAGISLNSTGAVTLRNMLIQSNGGAGITATSVAGLTVDNARITLNASANGLLMSGGSSFSMIHSEVVSNGTSVSNISNVLLSNVTGSGSVQHSTFETGRQSSFEVSNASGTFSLTTTNSNFSGATGGNGFTAQANSTGNISLNLSGSSFLTNTSRGFSYTGNDNSGGGTVTLNNNTFGGNNTEIAIAHQGAGQTLTANVTNNTVRQSFVSGSSTAVSVLLGSTSTSTSKLVGTISGNSIGNSLVANSGSDIGIGLGVEARGAGTLTLTIHNNNVQQTKQDYAFYAKMGESSSSTTRMNLTLTQNTFKVNTASAIALGGVGLDIGVLTTSQGTACLNLNSNNVRFEGHSTYAGVVLATAGTAIVNNLFGYGGGNNNSAAIESFLNGRAATVTPASIYAGGTGTTQGTLTACATS